MGGRGKSLDYVKPLTLQGVNSDSRANIKHADDMRSSGMFGGNGQDNGSKLDSGAVLKKCVCCNQFTIAEGSEYQKCKICGWIDDPNQNTHPDSANGKNAVSLNQARMTYLEKSKQRE